MFGELIFRVIIKKTKTTSHLREKIYFPFPLRTKNKDLFTLTRSILEHYRTTHKTMPNTLGISNIHNIHNKENKEFPTANTKKRKLSASTNQLLNLRVKRLSPKAKLPKRSSVKAAGYDLYRYKTKYIMRVFRINKLFIYFFLLIINNKARPISLFQLKEKL